MTTTTSNTVIIDNLCTIPQPCTDGPDVVCRRPGVARIFIEHTGETCEWCAGDGAHGRCDQAGTTEAHTLCVTHDDEWTDVMTETHLTCVTYIRV